MTLILVALAGSIGASSRFLVDGLVKKSVKSPFPFGTLTINIGGSFLLGLLTSLTSTHLLSPNIKVIVGTGFCGGYTTFSTSNFETVQLLRSGRNTLAITNALGTVALTMAAVLLGFEVG